MYSSDIGREDKVFFTFGRFNPPSIGHEKLIETLESLAEQAGAEARVYPSHSAGDEKNPLPFDVKLGYLKAFFDEANFNVSTDIRTPFDVIEALDEEGFEDVTMVVGQDRVNDFQSAFNKYLDDYISIKRINVVSAGDRDPEAEDVRGMSASKMRFMAANNDISGFLAGVPRPRSMTSETWRRLAEGLFNDVRKGLSSAKPKRKRPSK